MMIKRILIPTDFSAPSLKALDYAIEFVGTGNPELLLIHVVEPIPHTRFISDVSQILEQHRVEAAKRLAELEQETRRRHPQCRSEVHFGVPFDVIATIARSSRADLIIIGTHGYTGLYRLLLGSVAERVVRVSQCPVLTVPAELPTRQKRRSARSTRAKKPVRRS